MLTVNGTGNYQGFEVATSGTSRVVMISNGTDGYISTRQSGMGLIFETGASSEKMRILSTGNVGIGTSSPTDNIIGGGIFVDISSSTGAALKLHYSPSSTYGEFSLYKGSNGSYIDSAGAATLANNDLIFRTGGTASNFGVTERMRISSNGLVTISSSVASQFLLSVTNSDSTGEGIITYLNSSSSGKTFYAGYSTSAGAYKFLARSNGDVLNATGVYGTISSDRRLKENIVSATPKLNDIMKLNVVNFNLIGNEDKQIGFIAQEMQEVFPSFVHQSDTRKYDENGNIISGFEDALGVKVGMEFAILVKAIQEQQATITSLQDRLDKLENK